MTGRNGYIIRMRILNLRWDNLTILNDMRLTWLKFAKRIHRISMTVVGTNTVKGHFHSSLGDIGLGQGAFGITRCLGSVIGTASSYACGTA